MKAYVIIVALIASGCASSTTKSVPADALKPSQLNAHASSYDGKQVTVRGWLVLGFEKRYLVDDKRSYKDWPSDDVCVTVVNANALLVRQSEYNEKQVELRGTFHRDVLSNGVVRLGACNTSGLEIDETVQPRILN